MKNERILHADNKSIAREQIECIMESFGAQDGHKLVGSAASVSEVEYLLKGGLKPTIALVENKFPDEGDGERAATIIRKFSPKTVVVSLSTDSEVTWGDYNLPKNLRPKELFEFLTNLQH